MGNKVVDEIKKLELFKGIKPDTLELLSSYAVEKSYAKGEVVFRDKETVEYVYIVIEGKFSLYKISEDAQKRVIYILGKDKIINDVILDNLPASINCETFEAGRLLIINRLKFLSLMEKDFNLTKATINSLSIKVRRLYRQLKNTTPNKKIEKRVAAKLWKLAKDYGIETPEGIEINLKLSITYLADMFGCQRETMSRAIKQLQNNELITMEKKRIVIINRDSLLKYFKEP